MRPPERVARGAEAVWEHLRHRGRSVDRRPYQVGYEYIVLDQISWLGGIPSSACAAGSPRSSRCWARPHKGVRTEAVSTVVSCSRAKRLLAVFLYSFSCSCRAVQSQAEAYARAHVAGPGSRNPLRGDAPRGVGGARHPVGAQHSVPCDRAAADSSAVLTSMAIQSNHYQGDFDDLAWISRCCSTPGALVTPRRRSVTRPGSLPRGPGGRSCRPSVFLVPLIGYGGLFAQPLGGLPGCVPALLTG